MRSRYGEKWSREELILAFDLYCRIPFQQTKTTNPKVQYLAHFLGRTPASVARKLGNFGAFDPELMRIGISGLVHTSKMDREIWVEFNQDWNALVLEAHRLRQEHGDQPHSTGSLVQPEGPTESIRETKVRVHQDFFREAVLSSYNGTCCITGIRIPECLIASHIVPWSVSEEKRTDPSNGLCLSATFDRLFDKGLISITGEMHIEFSKRLLNLDDPAVQKHVICYHTQQILLPHRFIPSRDSLQWHRTNIFLG
ncbi:MAG TPA: HNH endonuclease [bacterium]|nr:HNH endonuclease [bacterium]HQL61290.1 HNH endonuclease [bacterium]